MRSDLFTPEYRAKDLSWLSTALHFAWKSKDPTKNGSICVDEDGVLLSQGWNGFPRGFKDTPERLEDRDFKLDHIVHAEENCILNAARTGRRLHGSTMYHYGMPVCNRCAVSIVQVGIRRVVMSCSKEVKQVWWDNFEKSKKIFDECDVILDEYRGCP